MKGKLSLFIQSIQDVVVVINNKGIIQTANPAITRILGFVPKEVEGKNVSCLMGAPHKAKHDSYINSHQTTGIKKIIGIGREVIAVHKDGTKIPVRLSVSEIENNGEQLYIGMLYDLTSQHSIKKHIANVNEGLEEEINERNEALALAMNELTRNKLELEQEILERKLVEERLRKSQKETQESLVKERELNTLKTTFISTASHEFRTPLTSILSSAALIERYTTTETNDKRLKHVNRIKSSVQNLTQILNDFLSLTKLEEGKIELKKHIFDLSSVIDIVIEEVSVFAKEKQTFKYQHTGEVSIIYSNIQSIKNVLINLLSNAIKYSSANSTIYIDSAIENDIIQISIKDEGIGIPLDQQPHLFTRFFRADNATNIQGTGLGLYIVKKYLENLNGSISFVTKLNEGTRFTIIIPKEDFQ
jgi:two-component system sensor kinase FixL